MKIVMDTKDLRDMLKLRKQYKYCQVFDSGDNTDGEGEEVYSFNSIYNDHSKYMSEEGRRKYEN